MRSFYLQDRERGEENAFRHLNKDLRIALNKYQTQTKRDWMHSTKHEESEV